MQRDIDSGQDKAEGDDGSRRALTKRRRSGTGLDSIVSGMREQEDRRRRSTPKNDEEPEGP